MSYMCTAPFPHRDAMLLVFSYLSDTDLGRCRRTCKLWNEVANHPTLVDPSYAFGAKQWYQHFGVRVSQVRCPSNLTQLLSGTVSTDLLEDALERMQLAEEKPVTKSLVDNFALFLVPDSLSHDQLKSIVETKFPELPLYKNLWDCVKSSAKAGSYWALVAKDIFYKGEEPLCQKEQLKELGCDVPSSLDVVLCALIEYVRHKRFLYTDGYTYCSETSGRFFPVAGLFTGSGINVCNGDDVNRQLCGIALFKRS